MTFPGRVLAGCLALSTFCHAQMVGRLVYVTGPGRIVRLDVLDGAHKAFITLPALQGQAGVLRDYVMTHTGPVQAVVPQAVPLTERAPLAWKVQSKGDRNLLKTPEATYWSYTPGLVLPVQFQLGKDLWRLQSADLPPRMFVSLDGR